MNHPGRVLLLSLVLCLVTSGLALACHSTYFDELFLTLEKQQLNKGQLVELFQLRRDYFTDDHQKSVCDKGHDQRGPEFIAAAAGILDDAQYEAVAGKKKTEVQKLRYDVNQLKKDIAEIKALLKEMQKASSKK